MNLKDLSRKTSLILTGIMFIIILNQISFWNPTLVYGENEIMFTSSKKFEIPSNNSSIKFSTNGTYEKATLQNGTWNYENLDFFNSQNQEKLDLKVSAINCDITINLYIIYNRTFDGEPVKRAILRYTVISYGTQVFDLGLDPTKGQLDARLDGEWVGKNNGWTHSSNGIFTITGATKNVTLLYYGFPQPITENKNFLANHSVILISTFSAGLTILLAIYINKKVKKIGKLNQDYSIQKN